MNVKQHFFVTLVMGGVAWNAFAMEDPKAKRNLDSEHYIWITPKTDAIRHEEYRIEYKPLTNNQVYEIKSLCAVSNPGFLEAFSIALTPEKVTAFNKDERIEKMVYNLIPLEQHIILNTSKEQRKALQHEKVMRDLNSDEHGQKGHIQSVMRKLEQARGFIEKHKADLHTYVGSDGIVKYEHPNSKYQVEQKGTMAFKLQHCEQNLKKLEEACAKQLEQVDQKINDVSSNKLGWSSKNVKNFGLLGSVFVSGLGLGGFFGWLYSKKRA